MLIDNESLYLYNITLKRPSYAISSVTGQFSGTKKVQEICIATSLTIELWRPNIDTGKLDKICVHNVFSVIQSLEKVRLTGSQKDYLVVTSDSGKLAILQYDTGRNRLVTVFQEPHSKTGFRRNTPGPYLLTDPQNRAILIGALERNKLIYKVHSDDKGGMQISSPLESQIRHTITLAMCALDTGYENPVFVAIEAEYGALDSKEYSIDSQAHQTLLFTSYELDQGLNHVVRRVVNNKLPISATHLIPLPSPVGGVLICCESYAIYERFDYKRLYLPFPIRQGTENTVIINHVFQKFKKSNYLILAQTQLGDCLKFSLHYNDEREQLDDITVSYFDTIPVSNSLNILRSGFLFANTAHGNKLFYQFEKLGEEDNDLTLRCSDHYEQMTTIDHSKREFKPKGLENLALVDVMDSLNPVTDATLLETRMSESPDPLINLVTLSSRFIKILTHGMPVNQLVTSPLPIHPSLIFTTKKFNESVNDDYLVISSELSSQTLVLSIGEVVEEVSDSEFVTNQPTIHVQQTGKSSIVQVFSNGIRLIRHIKNGDEEIKKTTDWYPPAGISVIKASGNNTQLIIGMSNREVCYFEIDSADDQLIEYQERLEVSGGSISSLAILSSKDPEKRSSHAIIGSSDETIQVVSLKRHNCLLIVALQALSSKSTSILMINHNDSVYVHIGMENGLYVRTMIDEVSGKLSDTRIKFLGSKSVRLSPIKVPGNSGEENGILALSSRPWYGYFAEGRFKLSPLINCSLTHGTSFYAEDISGEGIVGISESNLVILTIGSSDDDVSDDTKGSFKDDFTSREVKLRYLPKKMIIENNTEENNRSWIYVLESESGIRAPFIPTKLAEGEEIIDNTDDKAIDQDYYDVFGYEHKNGSWASCIQVFDYKLNKIVKTIEFSNDERILSSCEIKFNSSDSLSYLIVGTTRNSFDKNAKHYLYTFKVAGSRNLLHSQKGQKTLLFIHKTESEFAPLAMIEFNNRLLIGTKNLLRLYDIGHKQLLRKASSSIDYFENIIKLAYMGGNRIMAADASMSSTFVKYDQVENQFFPLADDVMKRKITSMCPLDYDTIVGGDKFGNVFVSRIPEFLSKQVDQDWGLIRHQDSYLNGAASRLKNLCEFYLGDIPTSFSKGSLILGSEESIFYTGLMGTVGALIPLVTKNEVQFFIELEAELRSYFDYNFDNFDEQKNGHNLLGKDHLKHRSYYNPVKNVIDGDLIERFSEVSYNNKIRIANKLDRTPKDIDKKISEIRNRSAF